MLSLADIRRRARSRLDDLKAPYLWSDIELLDYINDTIKDASVRANLVVQDDIVLPFTQKIDGSWDAKYALPKGTLRIRSVRLDSNPFFTLSEVSIRKQEQYYGGRPNVDGSVWSYALDLTIPGTGDYSGSQLRAITFLGTPAEVDTAALDIERTPADLEVDSDIPEIDEIWHSDLIYGIAALAYLKRDSDTFDPKRSEKEFAYFEERFGPRLPAVVIRERQTDVPYEIIVS